jgi:hypothetical protein
MSESQYFIYKTESKIKTLYSQTEIRIKKLQEKEEQLRDRKFMKFSRMKEKELEHKIDVVQRDIELQLEIRKYKIFKTLEKLINKIVPDEYETDETQALVENNENYIAFFKHTVTNFARINKDVELFNRAFTELVSHFLLNNRLFTLQQKFVKNVLSLMSWLKENGNVIINQHLAQKINFEASILEKDTIDEYGPTICGLFAVIFKLDNILNVYSIIHGNEYGYNKFHYIAMFIESPDVVLFFLNPKKFWEKFKSIDIKMDKGDSE